MESSLPSPYEIVEEGELMYSFSTVHGIVYRVYFLDYSVFLPGFGSVYSFNIEPEDCMYLCLCISRPPASNSLLLPSMNW